VRGRKTKSKHVTLKCKIRSVAHDKRYFILLKEKLNGIYFSIYLKVELKKMFINQYNTGLVKAKSHRP